MGIGQEMPANNKTRLKLIKGIFQTCAGRREIEERGRTNKRL